MLEHVGREACRALRLAIQQAVIYSFEHGIRTSDMGAQREHRRVRRGGESTGCRLRPGRGGVAALFAGVRPRGFPLRRAGEMGGETPPLPGALRRSRDPFGPSYVVRLTSLPIRRDAGHP